MKLSGQKHLGDQRLYNSRIHIKKTASIYFFETFARFPFFINKKIGVLLDGESSLTLQHRGYDSLGVNNNSGQQKLTS